MYRLFLFIPIFTFLSAFPLQCVEQGRDGGIFASFNRGEAWQQKVTISKKQTIADLDVLTIALDPQNSKIIYLGTRSRGIYKSMDGGEVWYPLIDEKRALDQRANVYDIAIDARDSNNLYIGTYQNRYGRFFRSKDGGRSWEQVYIVSRPQYAIFAVEVDSYDSSVVYMGTAEGGFLKSMDYGKSWRLIKWFNDVISDIKVNPQNTQVVYVSTFKRGVYKTTDKGGTWQSFESALRGFYEAEKVETLVIDRRQPEVLYAGSEYGLLKTTDGGQTWQKVNVIIPPETISILSLAIDPDNSSIIYYGAGSVFYKTVDGGKNWSLTTIPSTKKIKAIKIDPDDPDIIYIGMHK